MFSLLSAVLRSVIAGFRARRNLVLENLALRHQVLVLNRRGKSPTLRTSDRLFWATLSAIWSRWTKVLVIVQPQTVVRWHQARFRLYWRWRSRHRVGRTPKDRELIDLIRRMWQANPTWGSPRIRAELAKLGLQVSAATVRKYRPKGERRPPSQSWRSSLANHTKQLIAVDFFTVPTVTFRVLFVFVILAHDRRKLLHFAVTEAPSAAWAGQQIVNAFPFETPPKYLLRDRDGTYGSAFSQRVTVLGIEEKPIAPRAPWQNPCVERLIRTIRRECLDHVIVIGELHLQNVLKDYFEYYHHSRPHRSLTQDSPVPRPVQTPEQGRVVEFPQVGGLHHLYARQAA
ncbi:MAG: transposase [Verrucomicrobia bacterium]|nr:transposase [Verrucomicrobiota bacterium]